MAGRYRCRHDCSAQQQPDSSDCQQITSKKGARLAFKSCCPCSRECQRLHAQNGHEMGEEQSGFFKLMSVLYPLADSILSLGEGQAILDC